MEYSNHQKEKVMWTDGRYFEIEINGINKVLDLGHNFLEQNNLMKDFMPK